MPFTDPAAAARKPPAQPPAPPPLEPGQVGYDQAALSPDPLAMYERETKSPGSVGDEVADARTRALQTMNAARVLGPAIRVAALGGGDDREQAARFVALLNRANVNAQRACAAWGLAPEMLQNRWAMNSLERVFVEAMAGLPANPGGDVALVEALIGAADVRRCRKEAWEDLAEVPTVQRALLKGLVPVWQAQRRFDFFRNPEETLRTCAQMLLDTASSAVLQLAQTLTPASERKTMFEVFVEEGGAVLAAVWEEEAARARRAVTDKGASAVKAWRQAHPEGFPLDPVWTLFRQQMGRLVKLSAVVRPQVRNRP